MFGTSNLKNSIWPNGMQVDSDDYAVFYELGTNKVDIPTTEDGWPVGDKLISPFVYQDDKLVGFCDTKAMTANSGTTIIMPYEHIEADFSSIKEGNVIVDAPNATVKKFSWSAVDSGDDNVIVTFKYKNCKTVVDVKAVDSDYKTNDIVDGVWSESLADLEDGSNMFYGCSNLTTFDSDLSSLTDGDQMFYDCSNLITFTTDLSSLTHGHDMFLYCSKLTTFTADLSSLTTGSDMFYCCSKLTTFDSNLSSLTAGDGMFNSCYELTTFTCDLSSLVNGSQMFSYCSKLTTFTSKLSSLTNGSYMFNYCELDASSVKNIIDTIKTVSSKTLLLGMGCNNTIEDKDLFAQEVGYAYMNTLLTAFKNKGWTVTAQYNGRPTTTYALRRPTEDTLPIYAKLEEVTDEKYAHYTSEDGSKFFNINWFHETTGSTEGYTQFNSLEEVIETFNIKQVERN